MILFLILLLLLLFISCHPEGRELGENRMQEAECEVSYKDCIDQVYCYGGARMCYEIEKIEKKDDRSWCLVEKRCRKVLAEFEYHEKLGDRIAVAAFIFVMCIPFIALFCEICGKCKR